MCTFKKLNNYLKLFQDHIWNFSLYIIVILLYFGFPLISEFSYSIRLLLIKIQKYFSNFFFQLSLNLLKILLTIIF